MGKGWKLGKVYTYNGRKVIVSAINDDGTLVLNYAAGSGKTGFAGKISNPSLGKKFFGDLLVDENDVEGEGISLEEYEASQIVDAPMTVGDVIVTHDSGNVGNIVRIDGKNISAEYLKKHFPDFAGTYVGYAVNYDMQDVDGLKNLWTTVVELTEDGVTRRYVLEHADEDSED